VGEAETARSARADSGGLSAAIASPFPPLKPLLGSTRSLPSAERHEYHRSDYVTRRSARGTSA
jgi:hypothetical protein